MRLTICCLGILAVFGSASAAMADACSDLQACIDTSTTACQTAAGNPVCTGPLVSIVELRAGIAGECGCGVVVTEGLPNACVCTGNPKNFGKWRSCASHITNTLRATGIIDAATKAEAKADHALCKAAIKDMKGK